MRHVPIITINIVPYISIISHICVGAQFITPAPYHKISFPTQKKAGLINQPPTYDGTGLHSHAMSNTVRRPHYHDEYRALHPHTIAHLRRGAIHYARPIPQDIIPNTKKAGLINQPPTDDGTGLHSHTGMNTAPYVPIISCIDSHNTAYFRRGVIHYARPIHHKISFPTQKKTGSIHQTPTIPCLTSPLLR